MSKINSIMLKLFFIGICSMHFAATALIPVKCHGLEKNGSVCAARPVNATRYYVVDHLSEVGWNHAVEKCRSVGGHLITIRDETEYDMILKLLHDLRLSVSFWTAGNDLARKGVYTSIGTGERLPFTKWLPGTPDNLLNNEHCIILDRAGRRFLMNDMTCQFRLAFICESDAFPVYINEEDDD